MMHVCVTCCLLLVLGPLAVQAENSDLMASGMKCDDKDGIKYYWNEHCIPCPKCNPGWGLNETCGYGDGKYAQCELCKDETYSDSYDYKMCLACQVCSNVEYVHECTSYNNTECGPCKKGFYKDTFGNCMTCADYPDHKDCQFTTTPPPPPPTTTRMKSTKLWTTTLRPNRNVGIPSAKMIRIIQDNEDDSGENLLLGYKPDPLVLAAVILPCIACVFMIVLMIVLIRKNSKQKFLKFCHFGGKTQTTSHSGTTGADGEVKSEVPITNDAVKYSAVRQQLNDAYAPDTQRALTATPVDINQSSDDIEAAESDSLLTQTIINNIPPSDSVIGGNDRSQNGHGIYVQPTDVPTDVPTDRSPNNSAQSTGLNDIQSANLPKNTTVVIIHSPSPQISFEEKMTLARGVKLKYLLGDYSVMNKMDGELARRNDTTSPSPVADYLDLAKAIGMEFIYKTHSATDVFEYMKTSLEGDRDVAQLLNGLRTIKRWDLIDVIYDWLLSRQEEKT